MVELKEDAKTAFVPGETSTGSRRAITIISEGWGSSGYYGADVLARDTPKAFPVGTPMYLNHPTIREGHERPERDVRDLVGKLVETPRMSGGASVSVAHIYPHWEPVINALADDIGLSIRAAGVTESGSAEGRKGPVVKSIDEGMSIDFVTAAGAGGKIGPLIESARGVDHEELEDFDRLVEAVGSGTWTEQQVQKFEGTVLGLLEKHKPQEVHMTDEERKALADLEESVRKLTSEVSTLKESEAKEKARGDRAEEALVLREAGKIAGEVADTVTDLPTKARVRVIEESLRGDLPVDAEGKLISSELKERATKALKEEVEYIAETSGRGKVRGAGTGDSATSLFSEAAVGDEAEDKAKTALTEAFIRRGMSKAAAEAAAEGR